MNVKRMFALGNQRRHNDRVAIQPVPFRKIHRLGNVHAKRQQQRQRQQQEQQQEQQEQQQEQQQQQEQEEEQQEEEQQEECQEITFKIQTTKYLLNIANSLRSMLYGMKFSAEVMSSEEISREIEREIPGVHYIFLCIGHMFHLPKKSKYYIYNLEQVNYHPDFPLLGLVDNRAEFINTAFKNATNIFDYSEMNITNYPEDFKNKALYLPVPLEENPKIISEKEYDVLFFGGLNDRRKKILEYLKKDMNIRVVTNVFGEELYDMIKKARIVLNIHFKGESLLETARIYDCIRHSTPLIISEESIDKAVMEEYKDIVNFVPVIKEDLSNMDELVKGIQNLLSNGDICYSRWKAERKMQDMIKKRFDYFKIYKYPSLFHKYLLGISSPNKPITYELTQPDDKTFNNAKLFAHLHCYDISKFNEIYSEYIEKICSFFKVVITYSIGENNINDKRFVIIKIPNKGMDIGAKFCMVQYLNDNNISYEYIFFLHSKSDKEARRKYFMPLIENLNEGFIENINDYEGYFPDIQWEIQGNKLKIISGNPQFASSNLPERNLENRNDLLDYLGYENRTNRFVEGNVYILSKKIVDILFTDNKLYNILNAPDDFDYNWVRKRYGLSGGINNVYNDFKTKNLPPRDKNSYDGYVEHAFEKVVLNLCDNHLFLEAKIRLGVVITTNGFWGVLVRQCMECYTREFPEAFIVLFINESEDPITLGLEKEFSQIKVVYIKDQIKSGGLTSTWNAGIDMCMRANCNVIILSNDDILFDSSIKPIVSDAYLTSFKELRYYGPLTNNPGPAECNQSQYSLRPQNKDNFYLKYKNKYSNLNGFMMVFPKHVLLANKFDDTYYFDPKYPFDGNETEWFNRFIKIGGQPTVVPRTFIYHYKIARWRENQQLNNTCVYTINTGGYEGTIIYLKKSKYDTLYFTDNWKVIYNCIEQNIIPFYIDTKNKEAKLVQREIKTNVQNYLPYNYTRSLYVDGNLSITNYSLLEKYINDRKYDIICFDHPVRKKVKNEMIVIIRLKLETQENIKKIYDEFAKHDFKDNIGLTETNCLIRNHKNIIDFNNDWCNKVNICRRDQASFDFLLHKHKINYKRHLYNEKTNFTIKTKHVNSKFRHIV
uniref:Uncharacterized protein n=1 Tax=viral metagenome TaxID=1070528 RepID=A0A6C0C4A1_9ZZZZ